MSNRLLELSQNTNLYLTKYDRLLFLGDFKARADDLRLLRRNKFRQ